MGKNTEIWATDKDSFDIGCRVIKWDEKEGFDFTKSWKYIDTRANNLDFLRRKISQFTVHWSVTYKAKHMFNGLKARGLSVNFMIDDDCDDEGFATIYQCLPINKLGFSQGKHTNGESFNGLGPGVELSYMPQKYDADMYDPQDRKKWNVPEHDSKIAEIHGTKLDVHLPTEAQMKSLCHLTWGFCELFPNIASEFPRGKDNKILTTVLDNPLKYKGLVGHYHLRRGKIDPAGLDFGAVEGFVNHKMNRVPWGKVD